MDTPDTAPSPPYLQVAVDGIPVHLAQGVLTYRLPDDPNRHPRPGQLVWVPVKGKLTSGVVMRFVSEKPDVDLRPISKLAEPAVVLDDVQRELAEWMARQTASSVFSCCQPMLPPGRLTDVVERYHLNDDADPDQELTDLQARVIDLLMEHGALTIARLRDLTGQSLTATLPALLANGLVTRTLEPKSGLASGQKIRLIHLRDPEIELGRAAKQRALLDEIIALNRLERDGGEAIPLPELREAIEVSPTTLKGLMEKGAITITEVPAHQAPKPRPAAPPALSPEQQAVWDTVERALAAADPTPNLLFGVTGSGKTEIYLRGVDWCLRHGKTALVLVPEIGLATQVVRRFIDRFPGKVAVMHSAMTDGQRQDVWTRIANGEFRLVVGPRSVLFSPVRNLGMIVLDEEHDPSYKQDAEPRYHARSVAIWLAKRIGAPVILGSATPAVESLHAAEQGAYRLLELPHRVAPDGLMPALPAVEIVDLKDELRAGHAGLLSRRLMERTSESLRNGEQALFLLNRRGSSTIVICRSCGHRIECPNCDIPLVFHADLRQLVCHRCDYRIPPPEACPECGGRLDYFGAGTQRVEGELQRAFPDARVLRWDTDAVRAAGGHGPLLERVEAGQADIIVGTQMISKGFDLPHVTTIGVIHADSMLYLPDFRSAERTFQLLTQMAGRAGRRGQASSIIFQTYTAQHYAIQAAAQHDVRRFYRDEIRFREDFRFPPFWRLARFVVRHETEAGAAAEANTLSLALARIAWHGRIEMELLGPSPAFEAKIRGIYQWQIVLRTREMDRILASLTIRPGWLVDIDPESML